MVTLSIEQQKKLRDIAKERKEENLRLALEMEVPIEQVELFLGRATVQRIEKSREISGFDLFKKDWYKANPGNNPLRSNHLVSAAWKEVSSQQKQGYHDLAIKHNSKPPTLNPSASTRTNERRGYMNDMKRLADMLSLKCGVETFIVLSSRIPGENFGEVTGSDKGLLAAEDLRWTQSSLEFGMKIQYNINNEESHIQTRPIKKHKRNMNEGRQFIAHRMKELYREVVGYGVVPYSNWETEKYKFGIDIVGWPEGIPFTAHAFKREQMQEIINNLEQKKIKFISTKDIRDTPPDIDNNDHFRTDLSLSELDLMNQ
ncbi:3943_t:CDS:2 [Funneliformis caledonium]|uniref:3943_t:CDS:1 n=2 Tax=Funneliformis TaxID=1117308 RepID=A0A9N8VTF9_9GLOM|nr:3943_t:CDS:2 [Funneliformis caledonium]CAG8472901.1 8644_t:CDS:2 [Funneliformis mosseae]